MKIIGDINLKGDKSISHRALMIASMCKGESLIENLSSSDDILSTINCLKDTGIEIDFNDSSAIVYGGTFNAPSENLNCQNSGTSMRLLAGLYSSMKIPVTLYGDSSLNSRPMNRIINPLSKMGTVIKSNNGTAPISLTRFNPVPIIYDISIPSAQIKSCLILASMSMKDENIIRQNTPTRNHLELLIDSVSNNAIEYNGNKILINPEASKSLNAFNIFIPGDISSASYLIGLAVLLKDSELIINNLLLNSLRTGFIDALLSMGANIKIDNLKTIRNEKVGRVIVKGGRNLNPCSISKEKIPRMIDEIPILALICAHTKGDSIINGLEELRHKESDRLLGIYNILLNMGVGVDRPSNDSIAIKGENKLYNTNKLNNFNDHRLAMMISCAQILSENEVLFDDCIDTSFPDFKNLIRRMLTD